MVNVKTFVASIAILLYVFLQHGIRAQSNFGFSSEDDFCSQIEEKWKIQVVENIRMQCALYSQLQTVENHRLKFELEKKQLKIEPLENESISQADQYHQLNFELEKKQLKIETLENVSYTQAVEIHRLSLALEKKQLTIETLENESNSQADESHRLSMEMEKKLQKTATLGNVSSALVEETQQLYLELENKQQKIEKLKNVSNAHSEENLRLNMELEKKQQMIETLEKEYISHEDENHRLIRDLKKQQQKIKSLKNRLISQFEENHRLKLENERYRLRTQPAVDVDVLDDIQFLDIVDQVSLMAKYTIGADGYPAYLFTQDSDFFSNDSLFLRLSANFSVQVNARPDNVSGGLLFAIVNPAKTIIQFGLEIAESSLALDSSDIILYYTDYRTANQTKKLVVFTVNSLFGNWSKFYIAVKGDVITLYLNCQKHSTFHLPAGRVSPLNFEPGSVCYLAQGGPTFGRKFEGGLQWLTVSKPDYSCNEDEDDSYVH